MGVAVSVAVSVVMPVFDAGPYLLPALQSIEQQDLPRDQFELVAIDDGSTDGSGELLDRWAAEHPGVRVLHQPNSGWPGQPRNRGLDESTGEYVFFMDADDTLAPEALRRMLEHAREWDSDVLSPRVVGRGGRRISGRAWQKTTPDADLRTAFGNLHPQKLFRRSFLVEHGLRFPEGRVRLEDAILLARALLTADRVATAGDYAYYHLRRRNDGGNISGGALGTSSYVASIRTICATIRELCRDPDLADELVLSLYARRGLKVFGPDRFLRYSPATRRAWTDAVQAFAREHVPVALERRLPEPLRTRSALARAGSVSGQEAYAQLHSDTGWAPTAPPLRRLLNRMKWEGRPVDPSTGARLQVQLRRAARRKTGLLLQGRARLRGVPPAHLRFVLVLVRRGAAAEEHPIELSARAGRLGGQGWQNWRATVPGERLAEMVSGTWQVGLRTRRGELQARVGVPVPGDAPVMPGSLGLPRRRAVTAFLTRRGHLDLRLHRRTRRQGPRHEASGRPAGAPPAPPPPAPCAPGSVPQVSSQQA